MTVTGTAVCNQPNDVVSTQNQTLLLLQKMGDQQVLVRTCQIRETVLTHFCKNYDRQTFVPQQSRVYQQLRVPEAVCRQMWNNSTYQDPGTQKVYHVEPRRITYLSDETIGRTTTTTENINCHGDDAEARSGDAYGINAHLNQWRQLEVVLTEVVGWADLQGQLKLQIGEERVSWPTAQEDYEDLSVTAHWTAPPIVPPCPFYQTREVQGVLLTGQDGRQMLLSQDGTTTKLF